MLCRYLCNFAFLLTMHAAVRARPCATVCVHSFGLCSFGEITGRRGPLINSTLLHSPQSK